MKTFLSALAMIGILPLHAFATGEVFTLPLSHRLNWIHSSSVGAISGTMKAIIFSILGFFLAPSLGLTMEPVSIQGQRFYSAGQPYFPATHFLMAMPKS